MPWLNSPQFERPRSVKQTHDREDVREIELVEENEGNIFEDANAAEVTFNQFIIVFLVFFGGAIGASCRHILDKLFETINHHLPIELLGTDVRIFTINMLACFSAGICIVLVKKSQREKFLRPMLMTGFFGGFSTLAAVDWVVFEAESWLSGLNTSALQHATPLIWLFFNLVIGVSLAYFANRITERLIKRIGGGNDS